MGRSQPQVVVPGAMWGTRTHVVMPGQAHTGLRIAGLVRLVGMVSRDTLQHWSWLSQTVWEGVKNILKGGGHNMLNDLEKYSPPHKYLANGVHRPPLFPFPPKNKFRWTIRSGKNGVTFKQNSSLAGFYDNL